MQTKLSSYCDKIIEAGWLAAVIVAPLFFNINSNRIFDPEKTVLIRSIALVMLTAWLIGRMERGDREGRQNSLSPLSPLSSPLSRAIIVFAAVHGLSTITSIMPRVSLWGAYLRRQGTYATLSYIAIALLTAHSLRRTEQLQRLITTIILASWPVALYGVIQHYYLDPVEWHGAIEKRVISTIGNPIFVGAYLIMVIPLTTMRVVKSAQRIIAARREKPAFFKKPGFYSATLSLVLYSLILISQVLTTLFTKSRGPFVGMLGGAFIFLLLWAATRRRALVWTLLAVSVEIGLILLVLNLPNTPFPQVAKTKYGRLIVFGAGMNVGSGRLLIWQGAIDMLRASPFRALLGYGPETMFVAYTPFLRAELFDYIGFGATPDHAHNEMFDVLIATGIVGALAYLFVAGSAFYYGLKNLGLARTARDGYLYGGLWVGGGLSGLLAAYGSGSSSNLVGLTIPVGAIAGMILYVVIHTLLARESPPTGDKPLEANDKPLGANDKPLGANDKPLGANDKPLLVSALVAAIFAHFLESQFGISLASALTLFWIYIALLFVTGRDDWPVAPTEAEPEKPSRRSRRRGKKRQGKGGRPPAPPPAAALPAPFAFPRDSTMATYGLLSGLVLAILLQDFLYQCDFFSKNYSLFWLFGLTWLTWGIVTVNELHEYKTGYQLKRVVLYAALSLGSAGLFMLIYAPIARNPLRLDRGVLVFFGFLGVYLAAIGGALLGQIPLPVRNTRFSGAVVVYPFLLAGAMLVIFFTNLRVVQADVFYKGASIYSKAGRYDDGIKFYQEAIDRAPTEPHYHVYLGRAYAAKATVTAGGERIQWIQQADAALQRAHTLSPRSPDYVANLADLTHNWAKVLPDLSQRETKLREALGYYDLTLELAPQIYGERLRTNIANVHFMLGEVYRQQEQYDRAVTAYLKATELTPKDEEIHRNLVVAYWQKGQIDDALHHAYIARDLATGETRDKVIVAIEQLEAIKAQ